ncbi:MAG: hypothetical protein BWY56_00933 [Acidobacteria bacterium ADurb.Bin340]|nr:MAG: hypothetical protein BWY56_00933 [Acidobacteria bacterium ADurb.Bin340]
MQQLLGGARLVQHVQRLVRQQLVPQVAGGEAHSSFQSGVGELHAVVGFVGGAQALENGEAISFRGLRQIDLLEASAQGPVPIEALLAVLVGGGPDAAQLAPLKGGLEEVGEVQAAAGDAACAHQGVDFVDEEKGAGPGPQGFQHRLYPGLEIAAVAGAGQQGAHVQGIEGGFLEGLRHLPFGDAQGQAFRQGCLPHARLAHQQGVVLAASAQHLDHALQFFGPAHQWIQPSFPGPGPQVHGVGRQRIGGHALLGFFRGLGLGRGGRGRNAGGAVGEEAEQGQPRDACLLEDEGGVAFGFLEKAGQHIAAIHLARFGAEGMDRRPLQHPAQAQGGGGMGVLAFGQGLQAFRQEGFEACLDPGRIGPAGPLGGQHPGILLEGQQQVLQGQVFVAVVPGQGPGPLEGLLQRGGHLGGGAGHQSSGSRVQRRGNSWASARAFTWAALVSAMS